MKLMPLSTPGGYSVLHNGEEMGSVILYDNPFHRGNAYVRVELKQLPPHCAPALFAALREEAGRPLQVMVWSGDTALTAFLTAGGFHRARRCFEAEACAADYIGPPPWGEPMRLTPEDEGYERCCRLVYDHYRRTHEDISPLTAEYPLFRTVLPDEVFCAGAGGDIAALAFVEDNEIAYVWGRDEEEFVSFAADLTDTLLSRCGVISFECDDCDGPALWLKALFREEREDSWDTYIYL